MKDLWTLLIASFLFCALTHYMDKNNPDHVPDIQAMLTFVAWACMGLVIMFSIFRIATS